MIHDSVEQSEQSSVNLKLGCYGWIHAHWQGNYYPDDLPEDWQLSYYANDYSCVLVPAEYCQRDDVDEWLDEVHDEFRFYLQWSADKKLQHSVVLASEILQPQLGGVLVDSMIADVNAPQFFYQQNESEKTIWQPGITHSSNVAVLETIQGIDLRQQRSYLEAFDLASHHRASALLIKDAQCDHQDLVKMGQLIEMLGL